MTAPQTACGPGWTGAVADPSAPVTAENALDALAEMNTPRSLEAALMLSTADDDRQQIGTRLISAIYANERTEEVIEALASIGGQLEAVVLTSVAGEHEASAKEAIAAIKARP
jgi:hypothetical protein